MDTLVRENILYAEDNPEIILWVEYSSVKQREAGTDVYYTFVRKGKVGKDREGEIIQSKTTKITRIEVRDKPKSGSIGELVTNLQNIPNIQKDKPEELGPEETFVSNNIVKITEKEI